MKVTQKGSDMDDKPSLTGIRLWRWKLALLIYGIGCRVSGRQEALVEYDELWKVRYCPRCGWAEDHDRSIGGHR